MVVLSLPFFLSLGVFNDVLLSACQLLPSIDVFDFVFQKIFFKKINFF